MKVATWNVNSIRARLSQLLQWLEEESPDVVLLQETKCQDSFFPVRQLQEVGYQTAQHGQPSYNGVAILSKLPMFDVQRGNPHNRQDPQARMIAATIDNMRFISVYVPNGSQVGTDKYEYKLSFLRALRDYLAPLKDDFVVCGGDYNIAPTDQDVYDINKWGVGAILVSEPERNLLGEILQAGYADAQMLFEHNPKTAFSWWDYREANFKRNLGLRIDLMLLTEQPATIATTCMSDWTPRGWDRPSDHTPVVVEMDREFPLPEGSQQQQES